MKIDGSMGNWNISEHNNFNSRTNNSNFNISESSVSLSNVEKKSNNLVNKRSINNLDVYNMFESETKYIDKDGDGMVKKKVKKLDE